MSALQAVVFDLDDTLYPERQYVRSGFLAVATWVGEHLRLGPDAVFAELWDLFESGVRGDTFDRWARAHALETKDWVPDMVRAYRTHHPEIEPYPGVPQLLRALRARFRLGLVTDGPPETQQLKLAALRLASWFDAMVYTGALGDGAAKPSPAGFIAVVGQLSVSAGAAVYVADNVRKDFLGARRAGMKSVRLRHADALRSTEEPQAPEYAPDVSVSGLNELEGALARLARHR